MKTKDIFCANCQAVTSHQAEIDMNGEYLFTCLNKLEVENADGGIVCGRFIKFPADIATKKEADKALKVHAKQNEGQVSLESQEAKLNEMFGED